MIKKIASIFMTAVCLLSFTACHGLPKPVSYYQNQDNEEAESLVQENRQAFIDKVAEVYGESATLSDIECVRVFPEKYDAGYKSYHKELKGKLTIDGKSYEALYQRNASVLVPFQFDNHCRIGIPLPRNEYQIGQAFAAL